MSDTANQAAAPIAPAATPTPAQSAPAASPALEEHQRMSRDAFNARIAEATDAGVKRALKELGVEKIDDAKARLAKATEIEQAQLTESQRLAKQLEDLSPRAKRAESLEATLKRILEREEAAVPESKRGLLELAPTEPEARADWIANARAKGLFADAASPAAAAVAPRDPKPATTIAPPGPATPKPAGTLTPHETHQALLQAGKTVQAAQYLASHRKAVEASAPKP